MAGRIGSSQTMLIGNEGLPSSVVSNERLEMLQQQIQGSAHVSPSVTVEMHARRAQIRAGAVRRRSRLWRDHGIGSLFHEPVARASDTWPRTSDATSLACSMRKFRRPSRPTERPAAW